MAFLSLPPRRALKRIGKIMAASSVETKLGADFINALPRLHVSLRRPLYTPLYELLVEEVFEVQETALDTALAVPEGSWRS